VGRGRGRGRDDRRALRRRTHRGERAPGARCGAPPAPLADLPRRLHGEREVVGGPAAAERLAVPFVDLDERSSASGRTIRALFEESGGGVPRARGGFLAGTDSLPSAVVATGGGAFAQEDNRRRIERLGTSVLLDVPLEAVRARLAGKTDRPLFQSVEQLDRLFAERASFYRMADVRVGLSGTETVEDAADRVLMALEDLETIPG
jgi:shikimate kinase